VIAADACPSIRCTTFGLAPAEMASDAAVCRSACAVIRGNAGVVGSAPFLVYLALAALAAFWQRSTAPNSHDLTVGARDGHPPVTARATRRAPYLLPSGTTRPQQTTGGQLCDSRQTSANRRPACRPPSRRCGAGAPDGAENQCRRQSTPPPLPTAAHRRREPRCLPVAGPLLRRPARGRAPNRPCCPSRRSDARTVQRPTPPRRYGGHCRWGCRPARLDVLAPDRLQGPVRRRLQVTLASQPRWPKLADCHLAQARRDVSAGQLGGLGGRTPSRHAWW
jgi:hypothetical protein